MWTQPAPDEFNRCCDDGIITYYALFETLEVLFRTVKNNFLMYVIYKARQKFRANYSCSQLTALSLVFGATAVSKILDITAINSGNNLAARTSDLVA